MSANYLFRSASMISLLSLFIACVDEEPGHERGMAPVADPGTPGAVTTGDPWHDLAVTDGRIRLTVKEHPTTIGDSSVVPADSLVIDLETVAARRGDTALDVTFVGSELTGPGFITTVRAAFAETVENEADGIEQSWRFEHAPGNAGDLVIEVGATALDYLGSDERGLHLRRGNELDVSYSHGTWLDAGGHAWVVPARYDSGRILLTVPAAVVAGSAFPAVLDPQIIVTPIAS
jgi:hypothetical protein